MTSSAAAVEALDADGAADFGSGDGETEMLCDGGCGLVVVCPRLPHHRRFLFVVVVVYDGWIDAVADFDCAAVLLLPLPQKWEKTERPL